MPLTARGDRLLIGYDGKLTTNQDCCCDPPCVELLPCECYNADESVGTVPNATISIVGTLVHSGVFGGVPVGCLPVTLTDLPIDLEVELACPSNRNFRVFGPVICSVGASRYGLFMELTFGHSAGTASVRLVTYLGVWSSIPTPQPIAGVVYEVGVDAEAIAAFNAASGTRVVYEALALERVDCPQIVKPYCTPLDAVVETIEADNSATNACWDVPASGLTVEITR